MDAFSLLKYWSSSASGSDGVITTISDTDSTSGARAAIGSPYSSEGEDGPYFDLEFSLPDEEFVAGEQPPEKLCHSDQIALESENVDEAESESEAEKISLHENEDNDDDGGGGGDEEEDEEDEEIKFALASNECTDQAAAALSPSDELFFDGNLVSVEPSSILLNGSSEESSKLPEFLVKSATKFRILLLKLKKSKSGRDKNTARPEMIENIEGNDKGEDQGKMSCKLMAVKFKVEEGLLMSLFNRDSSAKENGHGRGMKNKDEGNNSDDRKLAKEVVLQKYLKMVKLRISKRYAEEKLKLAGGQSGCLDSKNPAASVTPASKPGNGSNNLQAGLKVVRKHLGKSRSASAAVSAAPPLKVASHRRDDSLVQVQDGIQGAILHCKRSLNTSCRDVEPSSTLCRSVSEPSPVKNLPEV